MVWQGPNAKCGCCCTNFVCNFSGTHSTSSVGGSSFVCWTDRTPFSTLRDYVLTVRFYAEPGSVWGWFHGDSFSVNSVGPNDWILFDTDAGTIFTTSGRLIAGPWTTNGDYRAASNSLPAGIEPNTWQKLQIRHKAAEGGNFSNTGLSEYTVLIDDIEVARYCMDPQKASGTSGGPFSLGAFNGSIGSGHTFISGHATSAGFVTWWTDMVNEDTPIHSPTVPSNTVSFRQLSITHSADTDEKCPTAEPAWLNVDETSTYEMTLVISGAAASGFNGTFVANGIPQAPQRRFTKVPSPIATETVPNSNSNDYAAKMTKITFGYDASIQWFGGLAAGTWPIPGHYLQVDVRFDYYDPMAFPLFLRSVGVATLIWDLNKVGFEFPLVLTPSTADYVRSTTKTSPPADGWVAFDDLFGGATFTFTGGT